MIAVAYNKAMATKKSEESTTKPAAARKVTKPAPAPQVQTSPASSIPIIAMILGVVSLVTFTWFLGIPAIILGIIGLRKYQENRGFSITGLITGIISTVLLVLAVLFFIVVLVLAVLQADNLGPQDESDRRSPQSEQYKDRYYRNSLDSI